MSFKIFIVIPVFNRIEYTTKLIKMILNQKDVDLTLIKLVFVDSDSKDGTKEYLMALTEENEIFHLVSGSLQWFWARAMQEGVTYVKKIAKPDDYVLLMNDDIFINSNYLAILRKLIIQNKKQIFSSRVRLSYYPFNLYENFPYLKLNSIKIYCHRYNSKDSLNFSRILILATGKATAYPIEFFNIINIKFHLLPHHFADLNLSLKVYSKYFGNILIPNELVVFSDKNFSTNILVKSNYQKYFSIKSPSRIFSQVFFYSDILLFLIIYNLRMLWKKLT